MESNISVPRAFSLATSSDFFQQDGMWSAFKLNIGGGNPPEGVQAFSAIVSTSGFDILLPEPAACNNSNPNNGGRPYPQFPSNCPVSRGIGLFNGDQSPGYQVNDSSTAYSSAQISIEGIELGALGSPGPFFGQNYAENASLYEDFVHLSPSTASTSTLDSPDIVPIFGYVATGYLLPSLGIGFGVHQSTSANVQINSTLYGMSQANKIPGQSWGYTAGAMYDNNRPASLTLGGFDNLRVSGAPANFNMSGTQSNELVVSVTSIGIKYNNGSATQSSPTEASNFAAVIDSTLPYLYLPNQAIDWLASRLHLSEYGLLFFYNKNSQEANNSRSNIDSFSFTISQGGSSTSSVNSQSSPIAIKLPYRALDAVASWPYGLNTTYMVPIRRMPAGSTYAVLGRSFLQEAYVFADFDRHNFSVYQAASAATFTGTNVTTVYSPTLASIIAANNLTTSTPTPTPSPVSSLGGGAIAGIVVGSVIGGFLILALVIWFCIVAPKKRKRAEEQEAQRVEDEKAAAEADRLAKSPELEAYSSRRTSYMSEAGTLVSGTEGMRPKYDNPLNPLAELEHRPVELEGHRPLTSELGAHEVASYSPHTPEI